MTRSIDREHVLWAYRLLLGREPESEAVVQQHLQYGGTTDKLVQTFLQSDEYRAYGGRPTEHRPTASGYAWIEQVQSPETVAVLLQHVAEEWSRLGEEEPHWSVLTAEQFRSQQIGQSRNLQEFRDSGLNEVRHIGAVLLRNGLSWPADGVCLEFGCGVGRVTLPLAAHCSRVVGVDISAGHLRLARQEAEAQGLGSKLEWLHLRALADLEQLPKADMVYSRIVLQHNPPPVIELLLRKLLGCLNPGGVAVFQVPTFMPGYSFRLDDYLRAVRAGGHRGIEMHMLPQRRVFELVHEAGCVPCEVFVDEAAGPAYTSHTFVVRAA